MGASEGEGAGGAAGALPGSRHADWYADYETSWTRLIVAAYFGPYLSHTGLTASWNGFLSAMSMISLPAAFAFSSAAASYLFHRSRSSACASRPNFLTSAWSSFDSVSQVLRENTKASGTIRCWVSV